MGATPEERRALDLLTGRSTNSQSVACVKCGGSLLLGGVGYKDQLVFLHTECTTCGMPAHLVLSVAESVGRPRIFAIGSISELAD